MDAARLQEAIDFAVASESKAPRDLELAHYQTFGREPFGEAIGPFKERGDTDRRRHPARLHRRGVGRHGARGHDLQRHEELSLDGRRTRLRPEDDSQPRTTACATTCRPSCRSPRIRAPGARRAWASRGSSSPFETEHNRKITWDHLLRQTSDWEGTLWGKPEWADRPIEQPGRVAHAHAQRAGRGRTSTTTCA